AHQQDERQRIGLLGRRQSGRGLADPCVVPRSARERGRVRRQRSREGDAERRRTADTIARSAKVVAAKAGFSIPEDKTFLIVPEERIGKQHLFSTEKLGIVVAIFRYAGFDMG